MPRRGFAAPEQFADLGALGPWTDIYGVGACLYACIVGKPPPRADHRLEKDDYQPLAVGDAHARYSLQLRALVDWCLRLDPLARPQSVHALQKALRYEGGEGGEAADASLAGRLAALMNPTPGRGE